MSNDKEIKKWKNKTNKDDGTGQTAVELAKLNAKIKLAEYNHLTQVSNNEVEITQINADKEVRLAELGSQQRRTESMFLYFVKFFKKMKIVLWLVENWGALVKFVSAFGLF